MDVLAHGSTEVEKPGCGRPQYAADTGCDMQESNKDMAAAVQHAENSGCVTPYHTYGINKQTNKQEFKVWLHQGS